MLSWGTVVEAKVLYQLKVAVVLLRSVSVANPKLQEPSQEKGELSDIKRGVGRSHG